MENILDCKWDSDIIYWADRILKEKIVWRRGVLGEGMMILEAKELSAEEK